MTPKIMSMFSKHKQTSKQDNNAMPTAPQPASTSNHDQPQTPPHSAARVQPSRLTKASLNHYQAEQDKLHHAEVPTSSEKYGVASSSQKEVEEENSISASESEYEQVVPEDIKEIAAKSPFLDLEHPIDLHEAIKMVVMFPVALFKVLMLGFAVLFATPVLKLLLIGQQYQQPMHPFRQALVLPWITGWGYFVMVLSGFYNIHVTGAQHLAEAKRNRAIIVFNHESYLDGLLVVALCDCALVAKASVAQLPFFGTFARGQQFVFVERKGSRDASNQYTLRDTDPKDVVSERAMDPRFPIMALAPEATTKGRPCLLRFRKGAFTSGQPIMPLLLDYRNNKHFYPGWGLVWTPFHVYRLLTQFHNNLSVEFMPVYYPSEEEKKNHGLYARNVRAKMAEHLGVPQVGETLGGEHVLKKMGVMPTLRGDAVVVGGKVVVRKEVGGNVRLKTE